ncbi:thiolase family protein [Pseudonocardia xishanensis]|uniref:propanoyl-CoA C-acyltransferase n=1 Tax=Pseudonocardia xishanensis TaxID=630995 RepID=A0ABP8RZP4_9PSEU
MSVIYGVGTSMFGRQTGTTAHVLGQQAVIEAFADAGTKDVQAAFVGSVFGASGVAQRALHPLGLGGIPIITIENACASGTTALHEAHVAVESGRFDRVLALGLEHMTGRFRGGIHPERTDVDGASGLGLPGVYAMAASRFLADGRVTEAELAAVSVKNHRHALGNERAQYRGDYTIEQVLESAMIADPLTLLQCCPISDGAAAAVVGVDRGVGTDVGIRGIALRSGGLWDHLSPHVWGFDLVRATAHEAFQRAGLAPTDVDLAEVHDAFTIGEVVTTEAMGLVAEGDGGPAAARGVTALGGGLPVNPSGGLLSRGHPLGATGLAQVAEVVWQLQGRAGARQVEGARVGVVETMGGGVAGIDGNGCVVAVLG